MQCLSEKRQGQAMLIAVLTLGAVMLGATTIAGFLMSYQIHNATDFEQSAQAVFAADAGSDLALYNFFVNSSTPSLSFADNATTTVICYDNSGNQTPSCGNTSSSELISKGYAGQTVRAFLVVFGSTTTTP